jgi:hypothetical protein
MPTRAKIVCSGEATINALSPARAGSTTTYAILPGTAAFLPVASTRSPTIRESGIPVAVGSAYPA